MQEQLTNLLRQWHLSPLAWDALLVGSAIVLGLLVKGILSLFLLYKRKSKDTYSFIRSIVTHMSRPASYFIPLFVYNLLLPLMRWPKGIASVVTHLVEIALIGTFSWMLFRFIRVVQDFVYYKFDITKSDNLRERKIRTQLVFIRQIISGLIVVLTIAAALLTFSTMRKIGTGLLTGVGIGGVIIGFAAQRSLANLLAGLQIAFTQPIRLDDALIVENEFGRVEEITLTYVVVRLWDERRLVLPINYFIEKPFQNWTRVSAQLLGTVYFYADYTLPIEPVRQQLQQLLKNHPLWDGRAQGLVVTNMTDKIVEIRALLSAQDSGRLWDLRCYVREHLLKFMQEQYPHCLPKTRATLEPQEAPKPDQPF